METGDQSESRVSHWVSLQSQKMHVGWEPFGVRYSGVSPPSRANTKTHN